ncbi:MAG: 2-oxoacid:acceptor oxidoreductase family protein [Methanomassiliicoccales archaeon]
MQKSVRLAGLGGQGMIFAGIVLARAVALYERRNGQELYAIQTQSYGPAARGETSKCDVVISDVPNFYPFPEKVDFLVIMSQPAYEKYIESAHEASIIILEEEAVGSRPQITHYEIPALKRSDEIGVISSANMIMLGALAYISNLASKEALIKAIFDLSPLGAFEMNERAFNEGLALGKEAVKEG